MQFIGVHWAYVKWFGRNWAGKPDHSHKWWSFVETASLALPLWKVAKFYVFFMKGITTTPPEVFLVHLQFCRTQFLHAQSPGSDRPSATSQDIDRTWDMSQNHRSLPPAQVCSIPHAIPCICPPPVLGGGEAGDPGETVCGWRCGAVTNHWGPRSNWILLQSHSIRTIIVQNEIKRAVVKPGWGVLACYQSSEIAEMTKTLPLFWKKLMQLQRMWWQTGCRFCWSAWTYYSQEGYQT